MPAAAATEGGENLAGLLSTAMPQNNIKNNLAILARQWTVSDYDTFMIAFLALARCDMYVTEKALNNVPFDVDLS